VGRTIFGIGENGGETVKGVGEKRGGPNGAHSKPNARKAIPTEALKRFVEGKHGKENPFTGRQGGNETSRTALKRKAKNTPDLKVARRERDAAEPVTGKGRAKGLKKKNPCRSPHPLGRSPHLTRG